jgi:hypothetical protein
MRFIFDSLPISFREGDTVLAALLRHRIHPAGGGCLSLAGDCPHCLATVDGVSYTRTCQVRARAGIVVERHPSDGLPPLGSSDANAGVAEASHLHCMWS